MKEEKKEVLGLSSNKKTSEGGFINKNKIIKI